ncbi:aconitate hydratase [Chlamydiota bacterium]
MGLSIAQKILQNHQVVGDSVSPGEEIGIRIDQCLNQDSTGTMVWLEFESLGLDRISCDVAVSYNDHTSLSFKGESSDDHLFLQTMAAKYGAFFSKGGNGVCHQIHYERFGKPGETLLGADSHTPTCGGLGMLAIGAGGMDVAVALAGGVFYLKVPNIIKVELDGRLRWGVSARDIIQTILRDISVKGGVGSLLEYSGEGIKNLTIPQRATITNMGAETGATTSIFPADELTKDFLRQQKRSPDYTELQPDEDACYSRTISINLNYLEPTVALPGMPDKVKKIREVEGRLIDQIFIGSCTNGGYQDIRIVADMLREKRVHPRIDLIISPGSRQVQQMLIKDGSYDVLTQAGARLIDPGCNACIGVGFVPGYNHVSLRTVNRNWPGRGGSKHGKIMLGSPQICAASAVKGMLSDPREFAPVEFSEPDEYIIDDTLLLSPDSFKSQSIEVRRGPNIVVLEQQNPIERLFNAKVILKVGDGISTDDILPAGPLTQHLRSNLGEIAKYAFFYVDEEFYNRAKNSQNNIVMGGENYGQGSSREHAALVMWHLGVKMVIAKSFARIHRSNLINCGVLPVTHKSVSFNLGDVIDCDISKVHDGKINLGNGENIYEITHDLTDREIKILSQGGILGYMRYEKEVETQKENSQLGSPELFDMF